MRTLTLILVCTLVCFAAGCATQPAVSNKITCAEKPQAPAEAKTVPCPAAPAAAKEKPEATKGKATATLIVVTNEANYQLCKDVLNFISTRGVSIQRISASEFENYKTSKYMLVLGGPSEPEGVGEITKQLLSPQEVEFVSQTGNRELYLKTNKWNSEQYILVIAGCDANATFRQLVNSKDKWWGYISSWFNIELSHDEVYGY